VPADEISRYGVVDVEPGTPLGERIHRVRGLIEKPAHEAAPSDLAIVGRYILTPISLDYSRPPLVIRRERSS
jgi:UTP--glucose-1-phosphate uridylyltransferase